MGQLKAALFHNLPIAAHPRAPAATVKAVQAAIDGMDADPEDMKLLEAAAKVIGQKPPYGFRAATPADYRSYTDSYRDTLVRDFK